MKILIHLAAVILYINLVEGDFDPTLHANYKQLNEAECGTNPGDELRPFIVQIPRNKREARLGEFPWVVLISLHYPDVQESHKCMGTIIARRFILTASSCFAGYGNEEISLNSVFVVAGEWDLSTDPDCEEWGCAPKSTFYQIDKISFLHTNAPAQNGKNLALLRTRLPINFNGYVGPICVDYGETLRREFNGRFGIRVSGWGVSNTDYQQNNKLMVFGDLDIVPSTWSALPDFLPDSFKSQETDESYFLIQTLNETSHKSDTGGPVMVNFRRKGSKHHRYYLYGVFSFETAFAIVAKAEALDVAAKVRYHLKWILDNMYLKDFKLPDKILKLISGSDY
ncbi:melanization protease 1-like [Nilaparvata lugens]|uniref:melanization protease 1-like n=1 Tax=Nilaparvata lugens TaxID=108931 RepID=UPI00193D21B1|nr:melanization protease 1-like [Nilaparvata lugens]